ncbi:unnamed protein product [Ectocarpus sp. 4 AP-2014]
MSAATFSNTANGGPSSPALSAPEIGGHRAAVAMAVAAAPSPAAAVGSAAGRDDDIVRALAFAKESTAAVLEQTANASSNIEGGSSGTDGGQGGESTDGSVFAKAEDPESCVQPSRAAEDSSSGTAVGHRTGGAASATSRSPGVSASSGSTQASWHDRRLAVSTTSSANGGRVGIAENGSATASARGSDARVNRGTAAGSVGAGDESDAGSVDEDNDDYTWFSSEKRVSGGERKHGRGRLGGGRVYDRVRITDHAEEINTLKQQLADGSIEESDGREKLRGLEAKTFTINIGDTIEIHSGNDSQPFVGKLVLLDRGTRRFRVRWYFVRHEVDAQLAEDMEPKEILLSDCLSSYQLLDTVDRKVDTVRRRPPHAQELPANTYLCYRGYDMKAKMIVPLLEDGSLEKFRRGKPSTKKGQASARGAVSPGGSSSAAAHTPPRASTSSSIMSPSNPSQEDNDPSEPVLLQRWNRTGPEFDVHVPKWTEPTRRTKPPPEEHRAAQSRFDDCQQWSTEALPFEPDALKEYLASAKAIAPIVPGTIVYIRPRPDGQWGDGKTVKQVRRPNGSGGGHSGVSADLDTGAGPRLSSMARSTYRWGLVAEQPPPAQRQQLTREQVPSRTEALLVQGAPNIPMVQEPATGNTGVEMPMTPQWFRQQQQQQHPQQYVRFEQQRQQQLMQEQMVQQQLVEQYERRDLISGESFRPQLQLPPNSLLQSNSIQQGSNLGGLTAAHAMAAQGVVPASTPRGSGNPHALAPSSVPGDAMAKGGAGVTNEVSVVWIASPSEGSSPLQVERSRIVGREFEEEAMNILWDARGQFGVALDIVRSKRYQDDLKRRLKNAGEIWTFQQVKAAVKTCTKLAAERRNEEMGELGDECTDEADYGVASKPFRCVVDFSRRFATLSRFGQNTKRRGTADAATVAQGAAATASTTAKRQRPKPGTYNDARPHTKRARAASSGSDRSCKQAEQSYEEEEEEEEEEETDSSEDDNYDPNESEGSSVIFVRGNKRRQRRKHRVEAGSGDSSQEDRKVNVTPTTTTRSRKPTSPPLDPSPGVIHDLCSSDEEDEMQDLSRKSPAAGSADAPAARRSPGAAGRGDHEGHQAMAPATAAKVEAAAAARETRGVAAEAAARAEADGADVENGGPAAAAGGGGGGAGMPSACPKEACGGTMSTEREGDGSGVGSDVTPPVRDDSPVPGVASGNTGGEAMASRPQTETGSVLHVFMDRCKATLSPELFDKFVSALSQYREQRLAIGELVDVVGQCFNHLEEREVKLVKEFNSFLPPGNAVKITRA